MGNSDIAALTAQIEQLERENQELKKWQEEVNKLLPQFIDLIEKSEKDIKTLQSYSYINRLRVESMPYEMMDAEYVSDVFVPKFLSVAETRDRIINGRSSISRLGDGEFSVIFGIKRWNFQSESAFLADKLKKVLQADDEDFLVGLNPNFYRNLGGLSEQDADGVRAYMRPEVRKKHAELLSKDIVYADGLMHNIHSEEDVSELKKIWDNKKCIFVEGEYTRMGIGNDLFDNCGEIGRILAPAENAADRYDDILEAVLKQPKDRLVLLALGPTATALSYDLFKEGYQAVDIGHIDLIYEQYLRKAASLDDVRIPFKYCSMDEIGQRREIPETDDKDYISQIIQKVC